MYLSGMQGMLTQRATPQGRLGTLYWDDAAQEWLDDGDEFGSGPTAAAFPAPVSFPQSVQQFPVTQPKIQCITSPCPSPTIRGTTPTASGNGTDWAGIVSSAISAWGNTTVAKTQAQVQAQYPRNPYTGLPLLPSALNRTGIPGYSPFPGVSASAGGILGVSNGTLLLLAAAGIAAFILMNR